MKSLIFDTGPVISLVTNNLLWILKPLKEKFNGEFYIPENVRKELIDKPLKTKKFKFEAITILESLKDQTIKIAKQDLLVKTNLLLNLANQIYKAQNEFIRIVSRAEIETLALASILKSNACVIDERTTRLLIENPRKLLAILTKKLHTKVQFNTSTLRKFQKELRNIKIIRSSELIIIAYELGLFNKYLTDSISKKELLDGLLWGTRLRGCSISSKEIEDIFKIERV